MLRLSAVPDSKDNFSEKLIFQFYIFFLNISLDLIISIIVHFFIIISTISLVKVVL